jgi:hypothetical protein
MINKQRSKEHQDALRKQRAVIRKLQEEVFALRGQIAQMKYGAPDRSPGTPAEIRREHVSLSKAHREIARIFDSLGIGGPETASWVEEMLRCKELDFEA